MKRILLFVFIIVVSFYSIKSISAKFEQGYTTEDNVVDYNFDLDFYIDSYSDASGVSSIEEYEVISVSANSYSIFNVDVKNVSSNTMYYGIWYKNLSDIYTSIDVSKYVSFANDTFGSLNSNETKTTTIVIRNNENVNVKVKIGVASSNSSVNDIGYYDGRKLIEGIISNLKSNAVNEPILSGDMIPVIYDEDNHYWIKADYRNKNNNWYDYYNKKWANVVLVKDDVRDSYSKYDVGTKIDMDDVLAFYVWIPRFKYLVWDINRQTVDSKNYSYNAKDNGIGIIFESDGINSGNVICNYNSLSSLGLLDECKYMDNNIVTINSLNGVYSSSWYTHPAFIRGDKNLSGFWIGKFETTGTKDNPTIIPDSKAMVDNSLADYFKISKKFNDYGIGKLDASIARNLEWGAVSYLTHSVYGLCDDNECKDININNSFDYYTGRSSGFYVDDDASMYGTYSYDGYGTINGEKDDKYNYGVMSSTTGNISGVYDMAGGASEYVLGNIGSNDFKVLVGDNSGDWADVNLDNYFIDLYSSFSSINDSYYKSRLGDATSEVSINGFVWGSTLKSNIEEDSHWIVRGLGNNIYGYGYVDGGASSNYSFRSVIS